MPFTNDAIVFGILIAFLSNYFLSNLGEEIGLLFQLADDFLDYNGSKKLLGKPVKKDHKKGKSTLLNLVNRLYDVNDGRVILDGNNIKDFKLNRLRSLMGNIPQHSFLFSESIEDNISFGKLDATVKEIKEACKVAEIHESIIGFKNGYETLLGERGLTLSGGQIQRVSIARAIIKNPKISVHFSKCFYFY